jgi:formylglycine-generating enzyme required for sulfatase activity
MFSVKALLVGATLLGASCGELAGGPSGTGSGPSDAVDSASVQAKAAASPSCLAGGPGLSDCGSAKESCCTSLPVAGGTFYRTYTNDGDRPTGEADPATVSSFRLDKYDVTVGRFRQFVNAWKGGWMPPAGSGKHTHLNGGQGLANGGPGGGYEPGWVVSDDSNIVPTGTLFSCRPSTWTNRASTQENLPINCVNWYEAYAFCIWDGGGFLPSEAEWEYAAAGGSQQREFPWGSADPGWMNQYAIYQCHYPDSATYAGCSDVSNIAPVGTAVSGAGRWGQLDLVGNLSQWNLDFDSAFAECTDCAYLTLTAAASARGIRGADFESSPGYPTFYLLPPVWSHTGLGGPPAPRAENVGFRCSRTP